MTKQQHGELKIGDRLLWVAEDDDRAIGATVIDRGIGRVIIRWDDHMVASLYRDDDENMVKVEVVR